MITEKSLTLFACLTRDYVYDLDITDHVHITYDSGAKLEINNQSFKLTTKDGEYFESVYRNDICVALDALDDDVFIVVYIRVSDYDDIYAKVFNMMIYERYP